MVGEYGDSGWGALRGWMACFRKSSGAGRRFGRFPKSDFRIPNSEFCMAYGIRSIPLHEHPERGGGGAGAPGTGPGGV